MLASQRRAAILSMVQDSGAVRVSDLVEHLGVSDMTVRRDIERLDTDGLLERVHGGALALLPRATDEPGFTAKSSLMTAAKHAIALAAARLVDPGATIGISAGTTTYEFARAIRNIPHLTVVTNSVPVAQLLHESGGNHVVVLTGGVRTPSDALVGPVAVAALQGLHVDRLFLGAHGIDRNAGLTTPNLVEAETNRALVRASRSVCVLADHSKVGIVGLSTFMALHEVDTLITDPGTPARVRALLEDSVDHLVLAEVASAATGAARVGPRSPGAGA
ncbi:putative DeoR-family transcriptional regulator [Janibacter sp. HTCC2649]|uniref:DeoR/GlpR family DNA-binding transcription regulator n=1 Tax=Janibacter sp. HTCC2649 TaxID=313589 RepID=UPI000067103D|nr:DeoR/GlpR family DNA-binding transcription regulator [Janibacter sp. HTCC2649]EAP97343.1 putative DeoR-family transcriptional regulator [Janibacter sp. HTCC2649]